jgi:ABC-type lipoprotein export system ATPase subunit
MNIAIDNISSKASLDPDRFKDFLKLNHLPPIERDSNLIEYWNQLDWEAQEESGFSLETLATAYDEYLNFDQRVAEEEILRSIEIRGGHDKDGNPERIDLCFHPGDVICLVGPTGAGKSRFLADIECLAQRDTPTGRQVLINGATPDGNERFSGESGLVAQITQNMNFVMDLPVEDFLYMHAESRALSDPNAVVQRVLESAIDMAGEPFGPKTQITQLSGGQSRSLMIADAAFLSPKPIVLIDEIENAGVDRSRALELFVEKGKIVLLSTHDPLLALSGAQRLVIRNGAVCKVITPSPRELATREELARLDKVFAEVRERLRLGERIDMDWQTLLAGQ